MIHFFKQLKHHLLHQNYFYFGNHQLPYFHHPYNDTARNERAIEIPIAKHFYNQYNPKEILEVGNVLKHYFSLKHQVVDKYEHAPGVINKDIIAFKPKKKFGLILAVSTLEHVGWDEYPRDPEKVLTALNHLFTLLKKDGQLVFTVPLGYNHDLDTLLRASKIGLTQQFYFKRLTKSNRWQQQNTDILQGAKYNYPFPCANELMVGMIRKS